MGNIEQYQKTCFGRHFSPENLIFKLYSKNLNVLMFFNFEFYWKIPLLFQILVTWLFSWNKNFLAAILKRNIFWSFFLMMYGCFKYIHIWCTACTEIPKQKYSKMNGSKWTSINPCPFVLFCIVLSRFLFFICMKLLNPRLPEPFLSHVYRRVWLPPLLDFCCKASDSYYFGIGG